MTHPHFPIASIVFEGDYRLSILQAISIDRLYTIADLDEYTIILNGKDNGALRKAFDSDLKPFVSAYFWSKTKFAEWGDLLGGARRVGYYDQQALKLSLGSYYDSELFLMLDAKNHFVRPSSPADFLVNGVPFAPLQKSSDMWRPYVEKSFAAVDVEGGDVDVMMPSVTPYLMYSDEVRAVAEHLVEKFGADLPTAMAQAGGTEFLMYYAHISSRREQLYVDRALPVRTLFTSWPQDPTVVFKLIDEMSEKEVPMFGLHRNRLPQLTEKQVQAITSLWRKYLLARWENPHWFLHH